MDPVTHGLTGALIAEAGFAQSLGKRSRIFLAGTAMFPDIDILYRIEGLPTYIANHRALTHSFVGLVGSGILLGALFGRFDRTRRYLAWISACWVVLFSHQILDLITSYGTVLLYPFNRTRYYFDWVFIVDLLLTGILLISLILSYRDHKQAMRRARRGLVVAAGYIVFCAMNHSMALYHLRDSVRAAGVRPVALAAIPQPILPIFWSGIVETENHYYQTSWINFRHPPMPFQEFTRTTGSFFEKKARESELGSLYFWFARYPVVDEYNHGNFHVVEFSDLRFHFHVIRYPVRNPFVLRIKMDNTGNIIESRFTRS